MILIAGFCFCYKPAEMYTEKEKVLGSSKSNASYLFPRKLQQMKGAQ
jgi:hypothetical protein